MMTTLLSGDLSHTPRPAFYITDTDLGGGEWVGQVGHGWLEMCVCVCVRNPVCVRRQEDIPSLAAEWYSHGEV